MERCQICGRAPAAQITLRRHVGMLIMQKFYRVKPTLCREHGRQAAKEWLTKTLVQGWWGIVSFFVNFVAVGTDIAALRKASKLGEPQAAPEPAPGQEQPQPPAHGLRAT